MAFADRKFFKDHYSAIETILKNNSVKDAYIVFDELTEVAKAIYIEGVDSKSINPGVLIKDLRDFFVTKDTSCTLDVCGVTIFNQKVVLPDGCVLFSTFKTEFSLITPPAKTTYTKDDPTKKTLEQKGDQKSELTQDKAASIRNTL